MITEAQLEQQTRVALLQALEVSELVYELLIDWVDLDDNHRQLSNGDESYEELSRRTGYENLPVILLAAAAWIEDQTGSQAYDQGVKTPEELRERWGPQVRQERTVEEPDALEHNHLERRVQVLERNQASLLRLLGALGDTLGASATEQGA